MPKSASRPVNVGETERLVAAGLALGLLASAVRIRKPLRLIAAGCLIYRAFSGHCYGYEWLGDEHLQTPATRMIVFLRIAFVVVLLSMLAVTTWASSSVALWKTPRAVATHPWFIATLFDTYFAFLTFYAWVAYKEVTLVARLGWLLAILLLGNIAMAIYMLNELFRLPVDAKIERLLLRRK